MDKFGQLLTRKHSVMHVVLKNISGVPKRPLAFANGPFYSFSLENLSKSSFPCGAQCAHGGQQRAL